LIKSLTGNTLGKVGIYTFPLRWTEPGSLSDILMAQDCSQFHSATYN